MSARLYLIWFSIVFATLGAMSAAINFMVDPYLVFGSPRIDGFNRIKVDINEYVRTAKAFEPFRHDTDVLLVGNSRIELGLNPAHPCFVQQDMNVYNLGIPGASVAQQLNYALNVIYRQPVRRIYLSVDFVDFLVRHGADSPPTGQLVATDALPLRFDGSPNPDYAWAAMQTRFQSLLSLNALISSARTVMLQGQHRPDRDVNGFNPAHDFARAAAIEGPGALFQQKMDSLEARLAQPWSLRYADGTLAQDFALFSLFLEIAKKQDVEVIVLTNPFHEQFWDLLRQHKLIELHAEWLAEIERRVRAAAGSVEMWDFSADSEFIHEPVPAPGIKVAPLKWFWEPAHYRGELGDLMIANMLGPECSLGASFGRKLADGQ